MESVIQSSQEQKKQRCVRKVIILGQNSALLAGYLRRASSDCVSFQLYSTLGVGIGVSRVDIEDNLEIALQLWSLPNEQRRFDFTQGFAKGHSGAIIVVEENELEHVPSLLTHLNEATEDKVMFAVVGSIRAAERLAQNLQVTYKKNIEVVSMPDVLSSMPCLVKAMYSKDTENPKLPFIVSIPEEQCHEFHPQPGSSMMDPPTRDEIREIKSLVRDWNVEVIQDTVIINMHEGRTSTDLESGEVKFKPTRCNICEKRCPRETKLCIVGTDRGWSDGTFGNHALLTVAKVDALASGELPLHVRNQMHRASQCSDFTLDVKCFDDHDFAGLIPSSSNQQVRAPLLEEARRRLEEGRLSKSAYDMLTKWLVRDEE